MFHSITTDLVIINVRYYFSHGLQELQYTKQQGTISERQEVWEESIAVKNYHWWVTVYYLNLKFDDTTTRRGQKKLNEGNFQNN